MSTEQKYRYFLMIVDDHSRMIWVYLLQNKSDYGNTLSTFYNYVNTHFGNNVKTIRSDNAPEFADQFCSKFMGDRGIVHQTTCSHRPQQNARVERKHRHILNVARAFKLQYGLPDVHWGDCVLVATYVINRLPSYVLENNISPYEIIFGKPPDYNDLKVFGCLVMASPPGDSTNKFKPRVVPCIFVGYPSSKRDWKLLTLDSMMSFVSRDVHFHEHIFPLLQSNAFIQPVHVPLAQTTSTSFFDDDELVVESDADTRERSPSENENNTTMNENNE